MVFRLIDASHRNLAGSVVVPWQEGRQMPLSFPADLKGLLQASWLGNAQPAATACIRTAMAWIWLWVWAQMPLSGPGQQAELALWS